MTRRLARDQAAIIAAYTGVLVGPFSDVHEYAEQKLGRPIFTHEFANRATADALRDAAMPDFIALCAHDDDTPPRWA